MFVPIRQITLDISNKCTLQCPKCARQEYRNNNQKIPGKQLTLKEFDKLSSFFNGYIKFCGNSSDPIMNPLLPDFLKICRDKHIQSSVATAATSKNRPEEWYINCFNINPKTKWIFGIDGLPHQSHWYRQNQDGEFLFDIMKIGVNMGIPIVWQYIVFKYNENYIEQAESLAKSLNIEFRLRVSHRWDRPYDMYKPTNPLYINEV